MQRRLVITATTIVLVLMFATPASAGPTRVAAPASPGVLVGPCPFDVAYSFPVNNEYSLVYTDADDNVTHVRTTGAFVVELTNTSNQNSVTLNISGPGDFVFNEDGSTHLTASGTWLFFFFPGQLGAGSPGSLLLNSGRTVIHTAADGFHQEVVSRSGTTSDVCAMIA